jgi:hypothetical protein
MIARMALKVDLHLPWDTYPSSVLVDDIYNKSQMTLMRMRKMRRMRRMRMRMMVQQKFLQGRP